MPEVRVGVGPDGFVRAVRLVRLAGPAFEQGGVLADRVVEDVGIAGVEGLGLARRLAGGVAVGLERPARVGVVGVAGIGLGVILAVVAVVAEDRVAHPR